MQDDRIIEYGEFDVEQDRDKYIGGSDIPVIMEISSFGRRQDLLEEKAGLRVNRFPGNQYTRYGHDMELAIREYVNEVYQTNFRPARCIHGDLRLHADGYNGKSILEIKTTSQMCLTLDGYKKYLVQLIKYMEEYGCETGVLAVYHRPEDMSLEFQPTRLQIWDLTIGRHPGLLQEVNKALDAFRADLAKLREHPLTDSSDLIPRPLQEMAEKIVIFENQLIKMKKLEADAKALKAQLFKAMTEYNVKTWQLPSGTRITRVDGTAAKEETVTTFDADSFRDENPGLYELYLKDTVKRTSGKAGYVKVTV
mgnify:FL=1